MRKVLDLTASSVAYSYDFLNAWGSMFLNLSDSTFTSNRNMRNNAEKFEKGFLFQHLYESLNMYQNIISAENEV